jgi:putative radical SAM enzyme (TIGR03279 family)
LQQIKWFQKRRLQIHAQVVVCPGINDGLHLEQTLRDLASFHTGEVPAVASVAVVPVGLTKFRPQQDELTPVTREKATEVIKQVRSLQQEFRQKFDSTFAWLADEWFLIAGEDLPSESEYEDYPQIDNGVGSIRLFLKKFTQAAEKLLPPKVKPQRRLHWVVGNAVEKAFQPILQRLNSTEGLEVKMHALNSDYWGQNITVTGLLTGHDLLLNLQKQDLGAGILLPTVMLKHGESVFLDDISIEEVARQLKTKIFPVAGVEELIKTCIQA